MERIQNYIGGHFEDAASGNTLENVNPATGEVYSQITASGAEDVDRAVEAARRAFPAWAGLTAEKRSDHLLRLASAIEEHLEAFALAESIDNGKPVAAARALDIPRAAKNFRFFATAILHESSEFHASGGGILNYTLRQPLGVVGAISPWNLPLYLFTWKIAAALAAGNCVVGKPSEVTPMTASMLGRLCSESGLPPGVLNIVHGTGEEAGAALVEHTDVRAVTFTGGTETGSRIALATAAGFKKTSLELGGKNPTIIFDDCDYENALSTSLRAAFANQGEICLCGSRIYVQEALYERFMGDFAERASTLVVGDPLESSSDLGALVSEAHLNKVLNHIQIATDEGGKLVCGGDRIRLSGRCAGGSFMAPTVITGLPDGCRTNAEEIFGPVVSLNSFKTEDEVLKQANSTKYGLSASLWTSDINRAHRMAAGIESGIVWINCWMVRDLRTPFGGVKESGLGREGGWDALRFFTDTKNVCLSYSLKNYPK